MFGLSMRAAAWIVVGVPIIMLLYVVGDAFIEDDNFRVVDQDIFRSGQLRADEWSESYDEHPYRSVLNLRGSNEGQPWYTFEIEFAKKHSLTHYDYAISAKRLPTDLQMQEIVSILRAAPKPLLIHCNAGSDRSGLVSALYKYSVLGAPADEAAKQLSPWYGHFPWFNRSAAMDEAFALFIAGHPAAMSEGEPASHQPGRRWPLVSLASVWPVRSRPGRQNGRPGSTVVPSSRTASSSLGS